MRTCGLWCMAAVAVSGGVLLPSRARAQRRVGAVLVARVIDVQTGNPLDDAELRLVELGRVARSDRQGIVRLRDIAAGSYNLFVRRLGYQPFVGSLDFHDGDSVEVAIVLQSLQLFDTVHVVGHASTPQLRGFQMRERKGIGHFLDDSALAREHDRNLVSIITTHIPGLRRIWDDSLQRYRIASTRGSNKLPGPGQPPCFVNVYLDDVLLPDVDFDIIYTNDLAAAEYYSDLEIPVQYRTLDSACGVLLLWSKFVAH